MSCNTNSNNAFVVIKLVKSLAGIEPCIECTEVHIEGLYLKRFSLDALLRYIACLYHIIPHYVHHVWFYSIVCSFSLSFFLSFFPSFFSFNHALRLNVFMI